jgi:hypothetical protein
MQMCLTKWLPVTTLSWQSILSGLLAAAVAKAALTRIGCMAGAGETADVTPGDGLEAAATIMAGLFAIALESVLVGLA